MARLIVKSPYFKGGSAKPAGGYLRYIVTRERVEILPDDRPPTKRQTQLIEKLTKDFPDTKTLLEYGDYRTLKSSRVFRGKKPNSASSAKGRFFTQQKRLVRLLLKSL